MLVPCPVHEILRCEIAVAPNDVDARRTKKNNTTFYGYKNHVKADTKTKLIEEYIVTYASMHDSQVMEQLLTEKDEGQPLNTDKSRTHSRGEHLFGFIVNSMNCSFICSIGITRAKAKIGMIHPLK